MRTFGITRLLPLTSLEPLSGSHLLSQGHIMLFCIGWTKKQTMTERKAISHKLRVFLFQKQEGKCALCPKELRGGDMEFDHVQALSFDGDNAADNWRILCVGCHKGVTRQQATDRAKIRHNKFGKPRKGRPLPGTRASGIRKRMNGDIERW